MYHVLINIPIRGGWKYWGDADLIPEDAITKPAKCWPAWSNVGFVGHVQTASNWHRDHLAFYGVPVRYEEWHDSEHPVIDVPFEQD